MLFGRQENPDPAQFWEDLQEELGEDILLYTLGELEEMPQGANDSNVPKERHRGAVGLCYCTDTAFYFHTFPEKSWFTTLVTSKKNRKEEFRLRIPRTQILNVELIKPEGWCKRILSSPLERLRIRYSPEVSDPSGQHPEREGEDSALTLLAALHGKGKDFLDSLLNK